MYRQVAGTPSGNFTDFTVLSRLLDSSISENLKCQEMVVKLLILVQKVWDGARNAALVMNSQVMLKLLAQDHTLSRRASLVFHVLPLAALILPKERTGSWIHVS